MKILICWIQGSDETDGHPERLKATIFPADFVQSGRIISSTLRRFSPDIKNSCFEEVPLLSVLSVTILSIVTGDVQAFGTFLLRSLL